MYGSVSVSLKAAESYADFDVRTFLLSVVSELRAFFVGGLDPSD